MPTTVVVVYPRHSRLGEAWEEVRTIYVLGLDLDVSTAMLEAIAAVPGGIVWHSRWTQNPEELALLLQRAGAPQRLRDAELIRYPSVRAGQIDSDWRRGEVTIIGKGNRGEKLPLPPDVGAAIAAYLRRGRPTGAEGRNAFVRVRAPLEALTVSGISTIVFNAAQRAGLVQG